MASKHSVIGSESVIPHSLKSLTRREGNKTRSVQKKNIDTPTGCCLVSDKLYVKRVRSHVKGAVLLQKILLLRRKLSYV